MFIINICNKMFRYYYNIYSLTCFLIIIFLEVVIGLKLSLTNNGPAVRGSNVTFTAVVGDYAGENLKFDFWDDAQPEHSAEFTLTSNVSYWTVEYPKNLYEAREYTVKVNLLKNFIGLWYLDKTATTVLKLTDSLNGNLILNQDNLDRPNRFVAVNKTVRHYVKLPENEMQFLKQNASTVLTYWFIDCMYIDQTTDMSLNYTYSDVMGDHYIDALVVANNEPLPLITTTTTTTTTTTSTTTTTTTTTPKPPNVTEASTPVTTITPTANTTVSNEHKLAKRSANNKTVKKEKAIKDFICHNSTIVPIGPSYTYGHYQESISIRETISTINITGMNWLQHGDLLNLQVKYTGSPPFNYCAIYKWGQYNITGNETCISKTTTLSNTFPLVHYFADSDQHTVVVVIENEIGKAVSRATINIYKASVHAQLSVIVVPVVFCLVAVILVVFGVAYYQHRSRYTVEVADFDFGQQGQFDYKSFTERLRDSFRNAFDFRRRDDTDPLASDTRYDSMT